MSFTEDYIVQKRHHRNLFLGELTLGAVLLVSAIQMGFAVVDIVGYTVFRDGNPQIYLFEGVRFGAAGAVSLLAYSGINAIQNRLDKYDTAFYRGHFVTDKGITVKTK